jgi:hypothetical protein
MNGTCGVVLWTSWLMRAVKRTGNVAGVRAATQHAQRFISFFGQQFSSPGNILVYLL